MHIGIGSSGAMVSCLGADKGRTPPILSGSEELDSVELASVPGRVSSRFVHKRAKSSSVIHALFSAGHPCQHTKSTIPYEVNYLLQYLLYLLVQIEW